MIATEETLGGGWGVGVVSAGFYLLLRVSESSRPTRSWFGTVLKGSKSELSVPMENSG